MIEVDSKGEQKQGQPSTRRDKTRLYGRSSKGKRQGMFVATGRPTAHFGGPGEAAAVHSELAQANQNDVRMETKSLEDEYVQSSDDSPEFASSSPARKQSQAGTKRTQIYREASFTQRGDVRVPRVKKDRRDTDRRRKANESDENQQDVQLLMKSLAGLEQKQVYSDSDDEQCTIKDQNEEKASSALATVNTLKSAEIFVRSPKAHGEEGKEKG